MPAAGGQAAKQRGAARGLVEVEGQRVELTGNSRISAAITA